MELNHNLHTVKTVSVTILCTFHWQGVCILPKAKEKIHRRIDIRCEASHCAFIGGLNKNDGDDGATKTSLKKWSREVALNCISLIPSCSTRQMLAIFLELNSKRRYQSSGKLEKKQVVLSVHVLHKTWNLAFSRRNRSVTAKKCTKKHDARAKLLFC